MNKMKIEPASAAIGVRISNVSLSSDAPASKRLSNAAWSEIEDVWNRSHALIFPDQKALRVEDQVAFLGRFGPVIEERIPGERHSFVTNEFGFGTDDMNAGYREGELTPHMDYTYTSYPADVISLYAVALPASGSRTRFFSNVAPLAAMPDSFRSELEGYSVFCAHDLAAMRPDCRLYEEPRTRPEAPTQSHVWPLIRPHPKKSGVHCLFCTMQQTERILELSDASEDDRESRAMLSRIFDEFLYIEENLYEHDWREGDLIVWDNFALQHARKACPVSRGARTLRRVAVCEAGNAIDETVEFLELQDGSVAF